MTFLEALSMTFEGGEPIRRASWPQGVHCKVIELRLCINWTENQLSAQWHPLIITEADYFSDDWEGIGDE